MLANGNFLFRNEEAITKRPTNEIHNKPSTGTFQFSNCTWSEPTNIKTSDTTYSVSKIKNVAPGKRLCELVTDARMMPNLLFNDGRIVE